MCIRITIVISSPCVKYIDLFVKCEHVVHDLYIMISIILCCTK